MKTEAVGAFETDARVHVALAVRDVAQSVDFYSIMFGQEPTKVRTGYAKFEIADPPLNLALNETHSGTGPVNPSAHFGVQVKSTEGVHQWAVRFRKAGLQPRIEDEVTCCYAVQSKVWITDPDGNKWEVFVVLDAEADQNNSGTSECCTETVASDCCSTPVGETCC